MEPVSADKKRSAAAAGMKDGSKSQSQLSEDKFEVEAKWFRDSHARLTTSPSDPADPTATRTDIIQIMQHLIPFTVSISKAVKEVADFQSNNNAHLQQLHKDSKAFMESASKDSLEIHARISKIANESISQKAQLVDTIQDAKVLEGRLVVPKSQGHLVTKITYQ